MPARVFSEKLGREGQVIPSRKSRLRAQQSSYAKLQEKLQGLTFEPFADLSPPFRELSPAVFLHHASPCLYIFKHGFLDDPHVEVTGPGTVAKSFTLASGSP